MSGNIDLRFGAEKKKQPTETAPKEKIGKKLASLWAAMETKKLARTLRFQNGTKKPEGTKKETAMNGVTATTPEQEKFLNLLKPVADVKITTEDIAHAEQHFQDKYGAKGWTFDAVPGPDGKDLPKFFLNGEPRNGIMNDKNGVSRMMYFDGVAKQIKKAQIVS